MRQKLGELAADCALGAAITLAGTLLPLGGVALAAHVGAQPRSEGYTTGRERQDNKRARRTAFAGAFLGMMTSIALNVAVGNGVWQALLSGGAAGQKVVEQWQGK